MPRVSLFSLLWAAFWAASIRVSVDPHSHACISDRFPKGSLLFWQAELDGETAGQAKGAVYILHPDNSTLAMKEFEEKQNATIVTANLDEDGEYTLCVTNNGEAAVDVQLTVRGSDFYEVSEESPTLLHFSLLDELGSQIAENMTVAHERMASFDAKVDQLLDKGTRFEWLATGFSVGVVVVVALIGYATTFCVQREIKKKKGL